MALHTVWTIWRTVMLYTLATDIVIFLAAGCFAAVVQAGRSKIWLCAPGIAALFGALVSVIFGAVPAVLLAAIYVSVPASMSGLAAAVFGGVQAIFIALANASVFRRIGI
jgi:hypothetical protein